MGEAEQSQLRSFKTVQSLLDDLNNNEKSTTLNNYELL